MIAAGVRDTDKVAMRTLNQKFGLPLNTIRDTSNMFPTIPTEFIRSCSKKGANFKKLPLDQQSVLVATVYVMCRASRQAQNKNFGGTVNPGGVIYGDPGYRPLSSFKTT